MGGYRCQIHDDCVLSHSTELKQVIDMCKEIVGKAEAGEYTVLPGHRMFNSGYNSGALGVSKEILKILKQFDSETE